MTGIYRTAYCIIISARHFSAFLPMPGRGFSILRRWKKGREGAEKPEGLVGGYLFSLRLQHNLYLSAVVAFHIYQLQLSESFVHRPHFRRISCLRLPTRAGEDRKACKESLPFAFWVSFLVRRCSVRRFSSRQFGMGIWRLGISCDLI